MKKWLYLAAALAAVGILSRLPHPAKDIAELKPVRAVYLYMDGKSLTIETDTGDSGSGQTLTEAAADLKSKADGEIFLETAEFLILRPDVQIAEDFYTLLRPACKVAYAASGPDMERISDYLTAHEPQTTLSHLRANNAGKEPPCIKNSIPSGSSPPSRPRWPISPAAAG